MLWAVTIAIPLLDNNILFASLSYVDDTRLALVVIVSVFGFFGLSFTASNQLEKLIRMLFGWNWKEGKEEELVS